ncbi:integral membrane protein 2A-like [Megalops cyprinoides]|uniref:integral membrane protein 2A-like n=1 Tax=Megalops cyprinoides TaxID=118141 RepID=UPI001864FE3E|nr:integral membrane protein 2A-like [Megalops cyprinoides]
MVKIAFSSGLAQKAPGKDGEVLVTEKDPETASVHSHESSTGRCLITLLGLAFILTGLIIGSACVYRFFAPKKLYHGGMHFTDTDGDMIPMDMESREPYYLPRIDEEVEICETIAIISVPEPSFGNGGLVQILHDFDSKMTTYLDLTLNTCFVIPLNTSVVMSPQDLQDLFEQLLSGPYTTYLVHEELVVSERIDDVAELGFSVFSLCDGKDTYRMQRRTEIIGLQKRSVQDCFTIRHFENKFVTETKICKA